MTDPVELPIDERLSYSKDFVEEAESRLASADDCAGPGAVVFWVKPKSMEDKIVAKHFVNAGTAVIMTGPVYDAHPSLDLLTLCFLVMENGFTVVGKSACASPENYDVQKGRDFAYQDAISQLWALEGYQLRAKLAGL